MIVRTWLKIKEQTLENRNLVAPQSLSCSSLCNDNDSPRHAAHPRCTPEVGKRSNFFSSQDYLTRVNRFFESRDTNISETILLVKCYTKLAQLLMDVVGSVAKFSRWCKEEARKGMTETERCTAAEKEDRNPKDKKRKFQPHTTHCEVLKERRSLYRRNLRLFKAFSRKALAHFMRHDLSTLVISAVFIDIWIYLASTRLTNKWWNDARF